MPVLTKLSALLKEERADYTHTEHPLAYTAREVAVAERIPAREVAKTVIVWGDSGFHMLVLPANKLVDFQEVRLALGLTHARLATEHEIGELFPDCELGAMPPFGALYNIPVYMDSSLVGEEHIAFNAGTHRDVIHMRTEDFRRVANPVIVSTARAAAVRHGW